MALTIEKRAGATGQTDSRRPDIMITNRAMLALTACAEMAESETPVSVGRIARRSGASPSYIEQVCGALKAAGIVRGIKGPGGGYRLADAPDRITALQIVGAVSRGGDRPFDDAIPPHPAVSLLAHQMQSVLGEIGLSDLTVPAQEVTACAT